MGKINGLNEALKVVEENGLFPVKFVHGKKIPAGKWKHHLKTTPTKAEWRKKIEELRSEKEDYNLGVFCGSTSGGIVVLDIETKDGCEKLLTKKVFSETLVNESNKGHHVFFKLKEYTPHPTLKKDGVIELRMEKSLCLFPPSLHPKGTPYKTVSSTTRIKTLDMNTVQFIKWARAEIKEKLNVVLGEKKETEMPSEAPQGEYGALKAKLPPLALEIIEKGIKKGAGRNATRLKLGNELYSLGWPEEMGLMAFHEFNENCEEPEDITKIEEHLKQIYKERTAYRKEQNKHELNNFIFDESKIFREVLFPFMKLDEGVFGLGVRLPKWAQTEEGNKIQITAPVIITNQGNIHGLNKEFRKKYGVRISVIPQKYERRWSLSAIQRFLNREYPKVDGKELFDKIHSTYKEFYFTHEKNWYNIHALWDMGTYFFLLFSVFPFLELRGRKGSGKNRVMEISRQFSFNPTEEMTNPSEATLFRDTHERRPTKYIDEAEKLFKVVQGKVEADSRAELLNSSYKKTGCVPRQEKQGNKYITMWYSTYSPTMFASINGLYGATEDRAIVHVSTKAPEDDSRAEKEPKEDDYKYQRIRDDLYAFTLQNAGRVEKEYATFHNKTKLKNRDFWVWKPLLVLAKVIDGEEGELYKNTVDFAEKLTSIKKIDEIESGSYEYKLLKITLDLLKLGKEAVLFKDIQDMWKQEINPDKAPHAKTIASNLDGCGLKEFKVHTELGNGYKITEDVFQSIIHPICPLLFSSSSSSPSAPESKEQPKDEGSMKEAEGKEEEEKSKTEANERNEANEDESELKEENEGLLQNSKVRVKFLRNVNGYKIGEHELPQAQAERFVKAGEAYYVE